MNIYFFICGILIGFGIRLIYYLVRGKDIPLFKYPYIVLKDGTVEKLVSDMDDGGVDKAVISPVDFGLMCGQEPEISVWSLNEYIAESQKKYPNRLIGFVGVDALRDDAIELLEKGVTEWGLKGVKIFPSLYKVTDERIKSFWDRVNDLELPIVKLAVRLNQSLPC